MLKTSNPLVWILMITFTILSAACSSSTAESPAGDMIKPEDKIGEMLFRQIENESELRPYLFELCDNIEMKPIVEDASVECALDYRPKLFLTIGMLNSNDLDKYWAIIDWEVSINGRPIDLEAFGTIDSFSSRWFNVLIENPASEPIEFTSVITINEDPVEMLKKTIYLTVLSEGESTPLLHEDPSSRTFSPDAESGQHAYHSDKANLDFLLFVPKQALANPDQQWPLILSLHGAFAGTDVNELRGGSAPWDHEGEPTFPAIVVSPHVMGEYEFWAEEETIIAVNTLLEEIEANLNVDPDRIYLTGFSAGGNGTWAMGLHDPDRFAALAPVAGYYGYPFTVPVNICDLKDKPIWAFHGAMDETVPLDAQQQIVEALKACGGNVQFTIYPDGNHDIDREVYSNQELYTWLLSQVLD